MNWQNSHYCRKGRRRQRMLQWPVTSDVTRACQRRDPHQHHRTAIILLTQYYTLLTSSPVSTIKLIIIYQTVCSLIQHAQCIINELLSLSSKQLYDHFWFWRKVIHLHVHHVWNDSKPIVFYYNFKSCYIKFGI